MLENRDRMLDLIAGLALIASLSSSFGCAVGASRHSVAGDMRTLTGTVSYSDDVALPTDAIVNVRLEDVSHQDVAASLVSEVTFEPQTQVPIPFTLDYPPDGIDERSTYAVRATIRRGDDLLFVTDTPALVLTRGRGERADLVLVRSGGGNAAGDVASLAGIRWILRTLDGDDIRPTDGGRPPYLQLEGSSTQLSAFGQGGCNTFRGTATLSGGGLEFGPLASTKMACPDLDLESRFYRALGATRTWEIRGSSLVLNGADGELATFEAYRE